MMEWLRRCALVALAGLAWPGAAMAQDFPVRPITLVVPLTAGGAMDLIARLLAPKLSERLGKPVIVENRAGGGTVTGTVAVAKSPPDGHTLLIAPSGTLTTNVALYKKLPYDPVQDFVPIALYGKLPFVLVVNPALPVHSIPDLIRYGKENPLSYGSTGTGTVAHLAAELLKNRTGIAMTHVPYRGVMQSLTDVVAGHVQLCFGSPDSGLSMIQDGRLRPLGVSSLTRVSVLPEVPPLADAGVPGFEAVSWHMILAPAATPKAVVERLHAEIKRIMAEPQMQRQITDMGLIAIDTPPSDELRRFLAGEIEHWSKLVQQAGIAGSE
jgi:tripartite-type tricarboxylate transporter receptor subunit TctC